MPPAYDNKAYREKSGIARLILNLGTTRKSQPGRFAPTGTHSTTNLVGPKADIEVLEKVKKKKTLPLSRNELRDIKPVY